MAVKWRKETFWVIYKFEGHGSKAVRKNGFTDGQYNYYQNGSGTWLAVLPDCGLSIAFGETRRKCRAAALKVTIPQEDKWSDIQKEMYNEGKRLIYEKTAHQPEGEQTMKRLTKRDEYGNADIIALSDVMTEVYAGLSFSETNALADVLNQLADYEDTGLMPEEIAALKRDTKLKDGAEE